MGTPHTGSQSPDKYKSDKLLTPRSEGEKTRYLDIYERYAQGALTQKQVAEEFGICRETANAIIKWAVHYLDSIDPIDAEKERRAIISRSKKRIQDLDNDLDNTCVMKDKAYLYREARMNDHLIGKASGALNDNKVNIDNRKIQVITNVRRRRAKTVKADVVEDARGETREEDEGAPEGSPGSEQESTDRDNNAEG